MAYIQVVLFALLSTSLGMRYLNTVPFPYQYYSSPVVYTYAAPQALQVVEHVVPTFRSAAVASGPATTVQVIAPPPPAPSVPTATAVAIETSPVLNQFHAQDETGAYAFGYSGGPSSRHEVKDDGVVTGSYHYIDPWGNVQTQKYVADSGGFRVAGTNLPVAPASVLAAVPQQVPDTPEVIKARNEFLAEFNKVKNRAKRSIPRTQFTAFYPNPKSTPVIPTTFAASLPAGLPTPVTYSVPTPITHAGPTYTASLPSTPVTYSVPTPITHAGPTYTASLPSTYSAAVPTTYATNVAPLTYSAGIIPTTYPAQVLNYQPSQMLRVVNNPGHAVSYRVY